MNMCVMSIRRVLWTLGLGLGMVASGIAQEYDHYFVDSTLRIDYSLAGSSRAVAVYVDELHQLAGWYGRRYHLDSLALEGNGRITVRDSVSRKIIYCNSFSTLFQEWLSTPEADQRARSFEHVALLPYPRRTVEIEVELDQIDRRTMARQSFYFNPRDILVRRRHLEPALEHEYVHRGGDPRACIDIAILAEGYTQAEMPAFLRDARRAAEELLRYAPFSRYRDRINIVAVKTVSEEAGTSVPRAGIWRQTAFSAHFDTFYSERYLTTQRMKAVHDALVHIPYEHIIILANTQTYGGGGFYNGYTISSLESKNFLPVVVHEFGHSFGGLADEYYYEQDALNGSYALDKEPWEQNITSLKDFTGKKWSSLIKKKTPIPTPAKDEHRYGIGVYEGAAYTARGLYKATSDCRMRTNSFPTFCPACHKALDELIRYYLYAD